MAYSSLHNHTDYSNFRLRDSINTVKGLMDYAIELGHSGIAFTEHETIANAIEIEEQYERVKKTNPDFKVIRGNEIYLVRNGLNSTNFVKGRDSYTHFILLALDAEGHKQIRQISSRAWLRSYMVRRQRKVPTYYQDLIDVIGENRGHIVGTTACIGGALGTQLLRYKENQDEKLLVQIKNWCLRMQDILGKGNFYFEMQPALNTNFEQIYVNEKILELSEELKIPYIISNDAHYLKKEDLIIEEIFLRAQEGEREVASFYGTTYLMSEEEIHSLMDNTIGFENVEKAFANSEKILARAQDYTLKKDLKIPSLLWRTVENYVMEYPFYFEKMPTLQKFLNSPHKSDNYLVNAVIAGIKQHEDLQNDAAYAEMELCLQDTWVSSQVNKAEWSAYFLNLQFLIDACWDAGTVVGCGRGSGVGFLLLYCLDITQINPMRESSKTFRFRFLNPDRVSVLDIDTDITGLNRKKILAHLRKIYGADKMANVLTLKTEKASSAILAAARGLGIDVDKAHEITALIPEERGASWTLQECMYGNGADRKPVKQFVDIMTNKFPKMWEVISRTENLIVGIGKHAGGIIFFDEPFENSTALMRSPDGDIMTQFELHTAEKASLIKYDILSVKAIDKIQSCLNLLVDYGLVKKYPTLRETYEHCIGIYNLKRTDPAMWDMVYHGQVGSLFQMDAQSGKNAIRLTHPNSVDDLATINSVLRLMAQEKGAEQPLDKFARFKNDISQWYAEMRQWGLTEDEMKLLEPVVKISYGICECQEKFMTLVQMPECGGFNLTWADRLRKSIAKKKPEEYEALTKEYFTTIKQKGLSYNLCNYVWNVLVATSKGYGFNASHTLAYSLIALQEINLAYNYPTIYWDTACLIVDSGGEETDDEEDLVDYEELCTSYADSGIEDFHDEEDDEGEDEEEEVGEKKKTASKVKANYGKIASAIGKIQMMGRTVGPPDINKAAYSFSPDAENNQIIYGMSGIVKIGEALVKQIIANRPYSSIPDFLSKVKVTKPQMVNLIKCGAFDSFGERREVMDEYIGLASGQKKRVTLQNAQMLIDFNLVPDDYRRQRAVFKFNKHLKTNKIDDSYYGLDEHTYNIFCEQFDSDLLKPTKIEGYMAVVSKASWKAIYEKEMKPLKAFIKSNSVTLLTQMNNKIKQELWDKYCKGNYSKWEMDSISFYSHPHELQDIQSYKYNISDFFALPPQPIKDRSFYTKDGKEITLYKLHRIAGTVLEKDKKKKLVTLLTPTGVVTVKIFGNLFGAYDKQISVRGDDGKKHIIEKSFLSRGNKIIITGMRREDSFIAKTYASTPYHSVELITEVYDDGELELQRERTEVEE